MALNLPEGATIGFDELMAGHRAECDGGSVNSLGQPAREEFAGTLTGDYYEFGTPPWRWYLMRDLTDRPAEFTDDGVWCEVGFLFLVDA
jgi:hypothetical protein